MCKISKFGLDIIISIFFMLLAIFIFCDTLDYPAPSREGPGVASFPRFIAIAIGLLAGFLLLNSIVKKETEKAGFLKNLNGKKTIIFIVAICVYVFLIKPIGFFISSIAFLTFLILLMQDLQSKLFFKSFLFSLVINILIYYIFGNFFQVDLPVGILGI